MGHYQACERRCDGVQKVVMSQKWKYLVREVAPSEAIESALGDWGSKGWELVTILSKEVLREGPVGEPGPLTRWTLIFKQPDGEVSTDWKA